MAMTVVACKRFMAELHLATFELWFGQGGKREYCQNCSLYTIYTSSIV